jgi:hypothetical protein
MFDLSRRMGFCTSETDKGKHQLCLGEKVTKHVLLTSEETRNCKREILNKK